MTHAPAAGERTIQLALVVGVLLIFLAVWKGEGGYRDLGEYLDNTENLWLKGDVSKPQNALYKPNQPERYYIHPLGIAVLSGPFVYAGVVIEKLSFGTIGRRAVIAFSIPVYSALACLLLYKIGRELQLAPMVSLWAALVLAIGSPLIAFTRLYFAESGTALSLCVASWAFLRSRADERNASAWALLAGAGLAGATACHFNNLWVSLWLWMGMSSAFLGNRMLPPNTRAKRIAALTLIPILAGAALLLMNIRRFGGPLHTGYERQLNVESPHPISLLNVPVNIPFLGLWLLRVVWAIPAFLFLLKVWRRERGWAVGIALAAISHVLFMQTFIGLPTFPIRYEQSVVIILSIGLLFLGDELWKRWKERGLAYSGLLLFILNVGHFIRSTDSLSTQTFWTSPEHPKLNCYVWYMDGPATNTIGTPMGAFQWAVLALLLCAGCIVLAVAVREAYRLSLADDSTSPAL